jgi:hypothetical protein
MLHIGHVSLDTAAPPSLRSPPFHTLLSILRRNLRWTTPLPAHVPFMSRVFTVDIVAGTFHCLTLHHGEGREKIPNTLACPFNVRKTCLTYLGFNCVNYKEGLVYRLMEEKKEVDLSCLVIGQYRLVFTSYIHGSTTNNNNAIPMTSTLKDNNESSYYATPLTQKIIKHGIA